MKNIPIGQWAKFEMLNISTFDSRSEATSEYFKRFNVERNEKEREKARDETPNVWCVLGVAVSRFDHTIQLDMSLIPLSMNTNWYILIRQDVRCERETIRLTASSIYGWKFITLFCTYACKAFSIGITLDTLNYYRKLSHKIKSVQFSCSCISMHSCILQSYIFNLKSSNERIVKQ